MAPAAPRHHQTGRREWARRREAHGEAHAARREAEAPAVALTRALARWNCCACVTPSQRCPTWLYACPVWCSDSLAARLTMALVLALAVVAAVAVEVVAVAMAVVAAVAAHG
eukprot:498974-Prymnesium_polylepis.1